MQRKIGAFSRVVDSINDRVGNVVCYFVLVATFIVAGDTIARYAFNSPTVGAFELTILVMAVYYLFGGAYALRYESHVKVDIIYTRMNRRKRAIVDLITAFLFFLYFCVILLQGVGVAWKSLMLRETTGAPSWIPVYPVKLIFPIAAFLIVLQGIAKFIRDVEIVFTKGESQ